MTTRTSIKGTGFCGFGDNCNVAAIDTEDGKLIRIRPLRFDWRFGPEHFKPWRLEARGKVFEPPMKTMLPPHAFGYKKRIYSPNRVLYPLKRVDWDPDGDRNPQNRGISGYERISWDEATDIIAKEIKRVIKQYGPEAILGQMDGHGETKVVHASHGCAYKLLNMLGGFTLSIRNPDSWEGWWWGAKHVWGCEPLGTYHPYQSNIYNDVAKHTDLIIHQGSDPETTPWGFAGGQMPSRFLYWYTELGIRQVFICPDLNYAAAVHADRWIPILPNTDAALQLAIAHIWITSGTYDQEYVRTHTVGFEQFRSYVLGETDGVAKTPTWAAEKTGVPSRIIKALARAWAAGRTTVAHVLGGPYIRGPFSHEPARLEVTLLAMQGLGKPGVHQLNFLDNASSLANRIDVMSRQESPTTVDVALNKHMGQPTPSGLVKPQVGSAYHGYASGMPRPKQIIPKPLFHDAILKGHFDIMGSSDQFENVDDQFKRYVYPAPGCSRVHMIWTDTPCLMTCWNDSNSVAKAFQHESIEFMLAQHPWMENDCLFADMVLPINTKYEESDIGDDYASQLYNLVYLEEKCIEPFGESR
jgi:trimethylamine-N-oxide reductase (cytochrome c)